MTYDPCPKCSEPDRYHRHGRGERCHEPACPCGYNQLPEPGERLVFGEHRMPTDDRDAPAWPSEEQLEAQRLARLRSTT